MTSPPLQPRLGNVSGAPLKEAPALPRSEGLGSRRAGLGLRLRPCQAQARPAPRAPSTLLHASALGAAILPLPLARLYAGVNSDFQHKTKMAAAASGECPDENASDELGPAPPGNGFPPTPPRVAEGTYNRVAFN